MNSQFELFHSLFLIKKICQLDRVYLVFVNELFRGLTFQAGRTIRDAG